MYLKLIGNGIGPGGAAHPVKKDRNIMFKKNCGFASCDFSLF